MMVKFGILVGLLLAPRVYGDSKPFHPDYVGAASLAAKDELEVGFYGYSGPLRYERNGADFLASGDGELRQVAAYSLFGVRALPLSFGVFFEEREEQRSLEITSDSATVAFDRSKLALKEQNVGPAVIWHYHKNLRLGIELMMSSFRDETRYRLNGTYVGSVAKEAGVRVKSSFQYQNPTVKLSVSYLPSFRRESTQILREPSIWQALLGISFASLEGLFMVQRDGDSELWQGRKNRMTYTLGAKIPKQQNSYRVLWGYQPKSYTDPTAVSTGNIDVHRLDAFIDHREELLLFSLGVRYQKGQGVGQVANGGEKAYSYDYLRVSLAVTYFMPAS